MSKITPGPWQILEQDPEDNFFRIRGTVLGEKYKIANVLFVQEVDRDKKEAEANANLIAMAPELLEALKGMKWFVDHIMGKEKRVDWGNTFDINWMAVNENLVKMERALKRAKVD